MMMAYHLDLIRGFHFAVPMMKTKSFCSPQRQDLPRFRQMPIMITRDQNNSCHHFKFLNQLPKSFGCGAIVNQVSYQNKTCRLVIVQEFFEPRPNRLHAPKWKQISGGALAQFEPLLYEVVETIGTT